MLIIRMVLALKNAIINNNLEMVENLIIIGKVNLNNSFAHIIINYININI